MSSSSSSSLAFANNDRIAVVTGSNKGIGYYIALQLASSGLFRNVILGCRDSIRGANAAQELQAKCENKQTEISFLPLTIGNKVSHTTFKQAIEDKFGKVDVLVNNAAMAFKGSDPTPFQEQCKPTLDVNFFGTVDFTNEMLPLIRKSNNDPRIVNVASQTGYLDQLRSMELKKKFLSCNMEELYDLIHQFKLDVSNGVHLERGWGNSNYGCSKLALIAATKVLARTEARYGIKVNCCCPGYCDTDMTSHKGPRHPNDGAKNAVLPATMENCPTGEFFKNGKVVNW